MSHAVTNTNQEWLKVLGKGMITIPKQWREELGLKPRDIVKAKKEKDRIVIEPQKGRPAPYRIYSSAEIEEFLKEDRLPKFLGRKVRKDLFGRTSK